MEKLIIFLSALCLLGACQQRKDDSEILKQILVDYFEGINVQDLQKLNSLTTPEFVLFENGKVWKNDSLIFIKRKFNSFKGKWRLENIRVNVDKSIAYAVYFNHGELAFNDTLEMKLDWLESATFRKVDNEWKLNFLHSTVRK